MHNFKILILACALALPFAAVKAQSTKSETREMVEALSQMDARSVERRTVQEQLSKKNYDGAITELNKILQRSPKDNEALLFRGLAYYYQKKYDQALSDLNKITAGSDYTVNGRRHALRAQIYLDTGNRNAALTEAITGIAADPTVAESYGVLEKLLTPEQYLGELSKALMSEEKLVSAHYQLYVRRAFHYITRKQYDLAVPDVVNALKRGSDTTFTPYAWSFLDYHFQGKSDAYIAELSKVIKDSYSNLTEALGRRAGLYLEQKKTDLAIADTTRAINRVNVTEIKDVTTARLYTIRAYSYANTQKYDLAITDLNKLLASKFYQPGDLDVRAQIYCLTGKKAEAREDEKKVVALGGKVSKPCQ